MVMKMMIIYLQVLQYYQEVQVEDQKHQHHLEVTFQETQAEEA